MSGAARGLNLPVDRAFRFSRQLQSMMHVKVAMGCSPIRCSPDAGFYFDPGAGWSAGNGSVMARLGKFGKVWVAWPRRPLMREPPTDGPASRPYHPSPTHFTPPVQFDLTGVGFNPASASRMLFCTAGLDKFPRCPPRAKTVNCSGGNVARSQARSSSVRRKSF